MTQASHLTFTAPIDLPLQKGTLLLSKMAPPSENDTHCKWHLTATLLIF